MRHRKSSVPRATAHLSQEYRTPAWEQRKLGELSTEFKSGEFICADNVSESGSYPVYGGNGLRGYTTTFNHEGLYTLIGRQGALCGNVNIADGKSYFTEHAVAVKANHLNDTTFLYYLFGTLDLGQYSGQSAQPGLAVSNLVEVEAMVPDKAEQKKISRVFKTVDSLITLHQRKYDKLCVLKKSMLDKMFPKGGSLYPEIRFAGFTDPWEQRKLGDCGSAYGGLSGKTKEDLGRGTAKFVPYTNVFDNPITDSNRLESIEKDSKQNEVRYGDALFTVSSETPGEVGMSSVWLSDQPNVYLNSFCFGYRQDGSFDSRYLAYMLRSQNVRSDLTLLAQGISRFNISKNKVMELKVPYPRLKEQAQLGSFFDHLDSLITLHQREYDGCAYPLFFLRKVHAMQETITSESLFCDYYTQWVKTYKEGAIRDVTMGKYRLAQSWLGKLIPELKLADMDRTAYQRLINGYAQHHERQTTMDFHHQIKGAILDAVDEGLIPRDPTRKVIIKGKQPRIKKMKYLNQFELHAMLADLDLGAEASWDWLILLIAKTGLRFSEALGLTPDDFDFAHQTLSVSKTWDYKNGGGFVPTKNESSVRKVQLDWQLIMQLSGLLKNLPHDKPIFVHGKVYNSTANDVLARHCKNVDVPVISIHGLRHTHASLLLFAGVSIASVSRRLGHASMTTTQETYLHVIRELENKDVDIVMRALSTLI
ncbi:Restriction endonuclease S subunit [Bifidobacterium merycicum DSM 6492]|nr:Restriction endonuclease S subunit [Bifidobacterium merycicum DSM 6492]